MLSRRLGGTWSAASGQPPVLAAIERIVNAEATAAGAPK